MNNHTAKHVNLVFENLVTCVCEDLQGHDKAIRSLKMLTALHEAADTTMAKLQLLVLRATIHLNTRKSRVRLSAGEFCRVYHTGVTRLKRKQKHVAQEFVIHLYIGTWVRYSGIFTLRTPFKEQFSSARIAPVSMAC